jgi:hypothetical protein
MLALCYNASYGVTFFCSRHCVATREGGWSIFCNLDKEDSRVVPSSPAAGGVSAARELFRNKTARAQDFKNDTDTLRTVHERAITLLQDASPRGGKKAGVTRISSSSLDGRLVEWDLPSLDIDMATLGL